MNIYLASWIFQLFGYDFYEFHISESPAFPVSLTPILGLLQLFHSSLFCQNPLLIVGDVKIDFTQKIKLDILNLTGR